MMHFGVGFGLSCDIEKSDTQNSGYKPASVDLAYQTPLFGELRIRGFAAAIECNFIQRLIIVGGFEARYPAEKISRAHAIKQMLVQDFGAASDRIGCLQSAPNTSGNIVAIRVALSEMNVDPRTCVLLSSHYHLPRSCVELFNHGIAGLAEIPVESLLLIAGQITGIRSLSLSVDETAAEFGRGALADRMARELSGIAQKIIDG
jgi:hypothetical protein